MIKVYRYNDNRSTASHILQGKNGMTVRYNFERGNVLTKQKPELILRNKFAQDLLESSELYKKGLVSLVRSTAEPSDVTDEATKDAITQTKEGGVEEVSDVITADQLIAYVNERWDKEYIRPANALDFATKKGVRFPNYNPE